MKTIIKTTIATMFRGNQYPCRDKGTPLRGTIDKLDGLDRREGGSSYSLRSRNLNKSSVNVAPEQKNS